jgi:fluoroacetyl-CoA thioesterase
MAVYVSTGEHEDLGIMAEELKIGLVGESIGTVLEEHTALAVGSGSLEVFATPALIALMESAAVAAVEPCMEAGKTTVGIEISVKHLAASPVGEAVRAVAEVVAVEGRAITFDVRAWDEHELIGEGSHIRYVIDVERFMARVLGYDD